MTKFFDLNRDYQPTIPGAVFFHVMTLFDYGHRLHPDEECDRCAAFRIAMREAEKPDPDRIAA